MRLMIIIPLAIALGSLDSANARVPVAAWRTGKRPRTETDIDEQALVKLAQFSRKSLPVAAAMLAKRDDDNSGDGDENLHNPALPIDDEKAHLKNKKYAIKAKRDDDSDYSSSGDDDSVDDDFKEKLKRNIGWMFPEPKDDAKKVAARGHATASEIVKRLQLLKQEMKEKN